jgi:general secretion pathway protein K
VRRLSPAEPGRNRGFVLLIVLWTLVLIGFIAAHLAASGRSEVRIAANLSANAAAQAAIEGAVDAAIFNLTDPDPDRRWPADGESHTLDIGESRVVLRIADEAGRINPNLASPALLEGLLLATGTDPDTAHRLALAIGQWTGNGVPETQDMAGEYQAAGLDYTPPLEPFETLDELNRVIGMTPEIVAALRPHLSLYGPAQPDPASADRVVLAALDIAARAQPLAASGSPGTLAGQAPRTLRVMASARGPGQALASAAAIIRFGGGVPRGYAMLAWKDGAE